MKCEITMFPFHSALAAVQPGRLQGKNWLAQIILTIFTFYMTLQFHYFLFYRIYSTLLVFHSRIKIRLCWWHLLPTSNTFQICNKTKRGAFFIRGKFGGVCELFCLSNEAKATLRIQQQNILLLLFHHIAICLAFEELSRWQTFLLVK